VTGPTFSPLSLLVIETEAPVTGAPSAVTVAVAVVLAKPSAVMVLGASDSATVGPVTSSALTRRPVSFPSGTVGVLSAGAVFQYAEAALCGPIPMNVHGLGWSGVPSQLVPLIASTPMYCPALIGRLVLNTYGVWLGPQKLPAVTHGSSGVGALRWTIS
jgi:hypothetical protein